MVNPLSLAFAGGVLVGFLGAVLLRLLIRPTQLIVLPPPTITGVVCQSDGKLRIEGSADPAVENLSLARLYSQVYDNAPSSPSPVGAVGHGTTFPLYHPLPSTGLVGPK